jgi:ribulose-phosphate 3-epimerase
VSVLLAPSILSADFGRLAEDVQACEAAGADWIHVDVMDGHFVPNITMGPVVVEAVRKATGLPLDVHLMIEVPERYLEAFAGAGADRITVHQETCPHLHRTLQQLRGLGVGTGLALNPATPVEMAAEVLDDLDLLLLMTVNPGFGGQRYIPASTDKVRRARALLATRGREGIHLQVDGGVDPLTAPEVAGAGADVLVAGSAVFRHPEGIAGGMAALRAALEAGLPAVGPGA